MRPLASIPVLWAAVAASAASAVAPLPDDVATQVEREGRARVIVRLAAPALRSREAPRARAVRQAALERAAEAALARVGGLARPDLRRYRALPLLALEASRGDLVELSRSDAVLAIQADRPLWPSLGDSVPHVGADTSVDAGFDGSGTVVVVLDTGVESGHAFLGGRVVDEACFSSSDDCPNGDDTQLGPGSAAACNYGTLCWHGTHVAGIVAGDNGSLHGVAPGASLIPIQIGSRLTGAACGGAGSPCVVMWDSDALAALDHVAASLAGTWNVASVNLSFSSTVTWTNETSCDGANPGYKLAFDTLRALGILAVAAAGNGGIATGVASPACVSNAIAVGASFDTGDAIWVSSNSGPPLDFFAPGTNVTSALLGGAMGAKSGTSMATPHVAGAVAALRQADPTASASALEAALESSGVPITDARNELVRPRLQVDDAVRARAPAACFDGLDNDSDGRVDVDGDGGPADPHCIDGFDTSEGAPKSGCGIGPELSLVLLALGALPRARRLWNRRPA